MATRGLRVCVAGATGALGTEVLGVLDASGVRVGELFAVAGEASLGADIEFQGEVVAVSSELPALQGLDLVFCCTPREAAAEVARAALRAEVPCVDATGVWTGQEEIPLCLASCGDPVPAAPLLAGPADAAVVWAPVLRVLAEFSPLLNVTGAVLESASAGGRRSIDALSAGSLALFNQEDLPEEAFPGRPLAFDCHPTSGPVDADGRSVRESELAVALGRLVGVDLAVSARWARIPAFVGQASCLWVELADAVDPAAVAERLAKAPGVELWDGPDEGPGLRAAAGRSAVVVGRPERDPARETGLRVWVAGDVLRLAAANAVALARARLQLG